MGNQTLTFIEMRAVADRMIAAIQRPQFPLIVSQEEVDLAHVLSQFACRLVEEGIYLDAATERARLVDEIRETYRNLQPSVVSIGPTAQRSAEFEILARKIDQLQDQLQMVTGSLLDVAERADSNQTGTNLALDVANELFDRVNNLERDIEALWLEAEEEVCVTCVDDACTEEIFSVCGAPDCDCVVPCSAETDDPICECDEDGTRIPVVFVGGTAYAVKSAQFTTTTEIESPQSELIITFEGSTLPEMEAAFGTLCPELARMFRS